LLGAIAAIALAVSLLVPAGRHQWALSIFRQPARYTALAFRYGWELPTTAVSGNQMPISFTIGNQEGRALTYTYVIRESEPPPLTFSRVLTTAARRLGPGKTWTVAIAVRPTCVVSPCRIQVSVPHHRERIDLLVTVTGAEHKRHGKKPSHRSSRRHARRT
jgi:hypothetical protein